MFDTAIIGAGPSGSQCAYLLARQGHKVAVLEKKPTAGTKQSCTGIIGKECRGLLPPGVDGITAEFNSASFFSPSGIILHVEKPTPQASFIDRKRFDNQMALAAQEAGAEYIFDAATETIEITGRKVIIGASKNGNSISIEAKSVVVASGFNPKFTRMLGLGQIEYSATGWQTEVDTNGMVEAEVYFGKNVAPGFFAWLVPFSPGRAKLGLLSRNGGAALLQTFWSDMYSRGKVTSPITETYHGAVPLKPLAKTYNDRVLVVGDAAGQVKPTTGGGIYYGLLCSTIAAACLHEAIARDDFSSKMLKKYQDEWHKKLYAELKVTYLARRAFQKLSDKQIDNIFETVSSKSIHEELLSEEDFSFDWHGKLILKALKYPSLWNPLGLLAYQIRHFHKQPYYSP